APVALDAHPVRVERERVCRRQTVDACEERLVVLVEVSLLDVVPHYRRVRPALAEYPGLACEREASDVEAVARDEERPRQRVPDRERPHAVEALHAALSPLAVARQQDLGVGVGAEAVTLRAKLLA